MTPQLTPNELQTARMIWKLSGLQPTLQYLIKRTLGGVWLVDDTLGWELGCDVNQVCWMIGGGYVKCGSQAEKEVKKLYGPNP